MASQKIGSSCIKKKSKQKKNKQKQTKKKQKTKPKKTKQKTAITLLGIYQKETPSYHHKSTYSIMFIETLFIIARNWKQPRYPSIKKRIKKMWYTYTVEYFTAIKNKDNLKFVQKIDGTRKYHHEWGNLDPHRQTLYIFTYKLVLIIKDNHVVIQRCQKWYLTEIGI